MPAQQTNSTTSERPVITAITWLNASTHQVAMVRDIHALLDTLFTRNKNQHRRSHWWQSLSSFRKQLRLLLDERKGSKKSRASRLSARLRYLDDQCLHKWYFQFSQLISVGPFAPLGLVLVACVARVCRLVGITSAYEMSAVGEEVQGILTVNDELLFNQVFGGVVAGWDVGEVVEREEEDE